MRPARAKARRPFTQWTDAPLPHCGQSDVRNSPHLLVLLTPEALRAAQPVPHAVHGASVGTADRPRPQGSQDPVAVDARDLPGHRTVRMAASVAAEDRRAEHRRTDRHAGRRRLCRCDNRSISARLRSLDRQRIVEGPPTCRHSVDTEPAAPPPSRREGFLRSTREGASHSRACMERTARVFG